MQIAELKGRLHHHGLYPKKKLGQHFLMADQVLDKIIEAAECNPKDHVIEVGPGTGILTERLLSHVQKVTAIEYDAGMVRLLSNQFAHDPHLELLHADILKWHDFPDKPYKVIANIPYYITSPILRHFLQSKNRPALMVLLTQKEVAEKVCGKRGKSVITIETQVFGKPEIFAQVPAGAFYPPPKVDSALLKIQVYKKPLIPQKDLPLFFRLVHFGFSQKRKKLSNSLGAGLHLSPQVIQTALQKAHIDPDSRAENLAIEDWQRLLAFFQPAANKEETGSGA